MSRNVRFKLSGRQLAAALQLAQDLKMPLDHVARQALFWAIRKAYDPNYKEAVDEPGAPVDSRADGSVSAREDVSSSLLEEKS